MNKYIVLSLLPSRIEIFQHEALDSDEINIIKNYAFPFGTEWLQLVGARSIKVFSVAKNLLCIAYTVVGFNEGYSRPNLYCVAFFYDEHFFSRLISSEDDWINVLVNPLLDRIDDCQLRHLLRESLTVKPRVAVRIKFIHWLQVQFHRKVMPAFHYIDSSSWAVQEEYARRLYLARKWQSDLLGIKPPSFTTLTLSKGEFTDIAIIGVPVKKHSVFYSSKTI